MKKIILSVAVLAVLFTGCKKKDDDPTPTPKSTSTKVSLLTAHPWAYTAAVADKPVDVDGDGNSSTDVYSQESICQTDVDYTFNSNKTGTVSGDCGGTVSPGSWGFAWTFNASETTIITTVAGDITNMTILQLDANTLKVSYPDTDDNNLDYINTLTFTKK
jgi:hypothetical protein